MTDYYSGCSCCSHLVLIAKEIKTMDSGVIVVKEYYECQSINIWAGVSPP